MRKTIMVLFGGCSSEHGVSLQSAQAVLEHLDRDKYQPLMVGITREGQWLCYRGPASAIGPHPLRPGPGPGPASAPASWGPGEPGEL